MKARPLRMETEERIKLIIDILKREYPSATTALKYQNPLELLIATILSAQSTDKKVNEVTFALFKKFRNAADYAEAPLSILEDHLKVLGLYKSKAKYIKSAAKLLIDRFDSRVPSTMQELIMLPGVARKTANIVLAKAYGVTEGIAVDTHVRRLAKRLNLTKSKNADQIEIDLMSIVPKSDWAHITDLLIWHGRRVCLAQKPRCEKCVINHLCPSAFTF